MSQVTPQFDLSHSESSANYFGESNQKDPPERRCQGEGCRTKLSVYNRLKKSGPYLCYLCQPKWMRSGSHICEAVGCERAILYREEEVERRNRTPHLCAEDDARFIKYPHAVAIKPKLKSKYHHERSKLDEAEDIVTDLIGREPVANDTVKNGY